MACVKTYIALWNCCSSRRIRIFYIGQNETLVVGTEKRKLCIHIYVCVCVYVCFFLSLPVILFFFVSFSHPITIYKNNSLRHTHLYHTCHIVVELRFKCFIHEANSTWSWWISYRYKNLNKSNLIFLLDNSFLTRYIWLRN